MRSLLLVVLTSLCLLVLAGPALAATIAFTDQGFDPDEVQIDPGETVIWVNETDGEVTIEGADGTWDSGPLAPGESFSVAFVQEGEVAYATSDGDHEGVVLVGEASTDDAEDGRDPFDGSGEDDADEAADDTEAGAAEAADEAASADPVALPDTGLPTTALALGAAGALLLGGAALRRARA